MRWGPCFAPMAAYFMWNWFDDEWKETLTMDLWKPVRWILNLFCIFNAFLDGIFLDGILWDLNLKGRGGIRNTIIHKNMLMI